MNSKGLLTRKLLQAADDVDVKKEKSNDPAVRLAFASKLDSETRAIQERQVSNFSAVPYCVSCDTSYASLPTLSFLSPPYPLLIYLILSYLNLTYLILSYLGDCAAVLRVPRGFS